MVQELLPVWIGIVVLGFTLIALRKGWLKSFFLVLGSISNLLFSSPKDIDLKWEVRRIRRLLEFFYFLTWLGLFIGILYWRSLA